jgi:hypothetical protein
MRATWEADIRVLESNDASLTHDSWLLASSLPGMNQSESKNSFLAL